MPAADWDDLRYVLAVARGGSLSAAARRLSVNHSTVFRRLAALEAALGARLFERLAQGYVPTAAGADLLTTAEGIEAEMQGLERRLAGRDHRLTGSVRLTAPDDMVEHLLLAPIAALRRAYPDIRLEMALDNRMLSLTKREADIAIRATASPPESLVGRRIGSARSGVYGARALLAKCDPPDASADLSRWPWIAWEEGGGPPLIGRWMAGQVQAERIVYRANSMLHIFSACRAGLGLAVLPCFLADGAAELARLPHLTGGLATDLWLLTHPDIRRTARIRAVMDFLFEDLRAQRLRLEGQRG